MTDPERFDAGELNFALDNTILANERTYAAWLRTGLAFLAAGLGTARFMADILPVWNLRVIVSILILFSALSFLLAAWRYQHLHFKTAHLDITTIPLKVVQGISLVLTLCALLALFAVWYL
jgi:inner membrane protein YidH